MRRLLRDDDLAAAIEADWTTADISPQRRAMLVIASKLTVEPGKVTEADIDSLREAGFSDRDILDIVEVTAYYAYVNRIADGLGVGLEAWIPEDS
ncbi:MAG: peroxidase-related enzyme [Acidimicrobiia bacterium]|nr:peroxidase-related enzyme [Actinomycetota bacterium]MBL6925086.1 peroxidase-related enzyme [Acidimicrobiia bacterium]MBL6927082.1 peroxidase-related enzyme [Acidimicrobiia bacterium]